MAARSGMLRPKKKYLTTATFTSNSRPLTMWSTGLGDLRLTYGTTFPWLHYAHTQTHTLISVYVHCKFSRCEGRRLYLYVRRTAGSRYVTLRPASSRHSLCTTCQQCLRQTFKWYMWARQGLRRHADRYNEAHLIKSLYCSELMNFQTN
jgi:hypothetical protein